MVIIISIIKNLTYKNMNSQQLHVLIFMVVIIIVFIAIVIALFLWDPPGAVSSTTIIKPNPALIPPSIQPFVPPTDPLVDPNAASSIFTYEIDGIPLDVSEPDYGKFKTGVGVTTTTVAPNPIGDIIYIYVTYSNLDGIYTIDTSDPSAIWRLYIYTYTGNDPISISGTGIIDGRSIFTDMNLIVDIVFQDTLYIFTDKNVYNILNNSINGPLFSTTNTIRGGDTNGNILYQSGDDIHYVTTMDNIVKTDPNIPIQPPPAYVKFLSLSGLYIYAINEGYTVTTIPDDSVTYSFDPGINITAFSTNDILSLNAGWLVYVTDQGNVFSKKYTPQDYQTEIAVPDTEYNDGVPVTGRAVTAGVGYETFYFVAT